MASNILVKVSPPRLSGGKDLSLLAASMRELDEVHPQFAISPRTLCGLTAQFLVGSRVFVLFFKSGIPADLELRVF